MSKCLKSLGENVTSTLGVMGTPDRAYTISPHSLKGFIIQTIINDWYLVAICTLETYLILVLSTLYWAKKMIVYEAKGNVSSRINFCYLKFEKSTQRKEFFFPIFTTTVLRRTRLGFILFFRNNHFIFYTLHIC